MNQDDVKKYQIHLTFTDTYVSIRDQHYPINSVHPSGSRFNSPGQDAFYFASGISTAKQEKYRDADASIDGDHKVYGAPIHQCYVFDLRAYLADHPEEKATAYATSGVNPYSWCRAARNVIESAQLSGTIYASAQDLNGVNVAVWPVGDDTIPVDRFRALSRYTDEPDEG